MTEDTAQELIIALEEHTLALEAHALELRRFNDMARDKRDYERTVARW